NAYHTVPHSYRTYVTLLRLHNIIIYNAIFIFFFNDTATTEINTLSLHDALPIYRGRQESQKEHVVQQQHAECHREQVEEAVVAGDRKSTRLNSSHVSISYAVFCLKKKNSTTPTHSQPSKCTTVHSNCKVTVTRVP